VPKRLILISKRNKALVRSKNKWRRLPALLYPTSRQNEDSYSYSVKRYSYSNGPLNTSKMKISSSGILPTQPRLRRLLRSSTRTSRSTSRKKLVGYSKASSV
jgi:hypothetical protein